MDKEEFIHLGRKNLYEIQLMNRERCQHIEFSMNQNAAVTYIGIGVHYDRVANLPVLQIVLPQPMTKKEVLQLLRDAISELENKIIEPPGQPGRNVC